MDCRLNMWLISGGIKGVLFIMKQRCCWLGSIFLSSSFSSTAEISIFQLCGILDLLSSVFYEYIILCTPCGLIGCFKNFASSKKKKKLYGKKNHM